MFHVEQSIFLIIAVDNVPRGTFFETNKLSLKSLSFRKLYFALFKPSIQSIAYTKYLFHVEHF